MGHWTKPGLSAKPPRVLRRIVFYVLLVLLATGAFVVRSWNLREVFLQGRIFFVDPDCYSRMARARMVATGEQWVVRQHEFENHPHGIRPHTTAPLDWAIAAFRWPLAGAIRLGGDALWARVLRTQTLEVSGALISPLLGALTCGWIAWAFCRLPGLPRSGGWAAALLFALSPMAVHGTLLGRPDHQSLMLALLAVALAAEVRLALAAEYLDSERRWALAAGVAWGGACWVSFYEPLVMLAVVLLFWVCADRRRFTRRECWPGWIAFAAIIVLSVIIEGWRISVPSSELREAFTRWSSKIGELQPAGIGLMASWVGALGLAAPLALLAMVIIRLRKNAEPGGWQTPALMATLLVPLFALTVWQARWGYFLALAAAFAMPLMFAAMRRAWIAWPVFILALWPVAADWDARLFPDEETERKRLLLRAENVALREIAEVQGERRAGAFVAPWWLSPPIAYWSGLPAVAGSSHESLPGILDTARVYLADDAGAALAILRERQVSWLISYPPERIIPNSASLLAESPPRKCFAHDLVERVLPDPWTLALIRERGVTGPQGREFFQLWTVRRSMTPDPEEEEHAHEGE